MQHKILVEKATEMDEFFLEMFINGKKSVIQATLTPGKPEPQITNSVRKQLEKTMEGKPHLIVYDRTSQRILAVQARFVSSIQPLNSVFK